MLTPRSKPSRLTRMNSSARALEPRGHHAAVVVPHGTKALPVAGVAPNHPVLDQLADRQPIGSTRIRHLVRGDALRAPPSHRVIMVDSVHDADIVAPGDGIAHAHHYAVRARLRCRSHSTRRGTSDIATMTSATISKWSRTSGMLPNQ